MDTTLPCMEGGRIPNRLKKYRRLAGYSQKEAAAMLDLKHSSCISQWEKGRSVPSLPHIFKLSALYKTHPIHLYQEFWQYLKEEVLKKEESVQYIISLLAATKHILYDVK